MLFGKRLFPYPILNSDKSLNQFPKNKFQGLFETESDESDLIFKNAHYELNNEYLQKLIKNKKAKCVLYVECPSTRFRRLFELSSKPTEIRIPLYDLNGQVQVCTYVYANQNIKPYSPEGIDEIYGDFRNFEVEKYDILAIDEYNRFRVAFDVESDNLTSSIFLVIGDPNIKDDKIIVHPTERKIEISVSTQVYEWYTAIKSISDYKWMPFSIMLISALQQAFEEIKTDPDIESIEDIENSYQWFMSVESRYEKTFSRKLSYSEFKGTQSFDLAQELLDKPNGKAIQNSFDLITEGGNTDD